MGFGAGSETNQPLAVAVVGGMISSTLLTLVVVPAVYSLLEGWRERAGAAKAPPRATARTCRRAGCAARVAVAGGSPAATGIVVELQQALAGEAGINRTSASR